MNPNQFRIGNFISREDLGDNHERFETVLELGRKLIASGPLKVICEYDEIKPIPLTEEWLLKFGFEKLYETKVRSVFDFIKDYRFGYLDNHGLENISSGVTFMGHKFDNIKYVHQLQNLFLDLTGQELTLQKTNSNLQ